MGRIQCMLITMNSGKNYGSIEERDHQVSTTGNDCKEMAFGKHEEG